MQVLLVEAGGVHTILNDMPVLYGQHGADQDWNYRTAPQPNICNGTTCQFWRGKVLGGCTTINGMVYMRGNPRDYDLWESEFGARGWNYEAMFPYFLKTERNYNYSAPWHSNQGEVGVTYPGEYDPRLMLWVNAMRAAGYPFGDLNAPHRAGVDILQKTIVQGLRQSTANTFLEPNRWRPNLDIVVNSHVTKVLLDTSGPTPTAVGVEIYRNNRTETAQARREVIVSGGVVNSPQLLMLSGLGPRDLLESLGIPVVVDLPGVGQNYNEHIRMYAFSFQTNITVEAIDGHTDDALSLDNLYEYFVNRVGLLSRFQNGYAFATSSVSRDPNWPDISIQVINFLSIPFFYNTSRFNNKIILHC